MDRASEALLLEFCAAQRLDFDRSAWPAFTAVSRVELAAVAHFLAGVDWFGHEKALLEVVVTLQPGRVGEFHRLAREAQFDAARFSQHLRRRLALHESRVP